MKPYTIALYSMNKPDALEGIRDSLHMIGFGLWSELAKLPHVLPRYSNTFAPEVEIVPADFTLIHDCHDSPIYRRLPEIRAATRRKTMHFMEWPYEGKDSDLIDRTFCYLPIPGTDYIPFPCLRDVLAAHADEKQPGSILLDHVWLSAENTEQDWCPRLYQWLEAFDGKRFIAQLCRNNHAAAQHFPPWIAPVPESCYPEYLRSTSTIETFILTHPGSYEHSVLDMTARGTRVLIPTLGGKPFVHPSIVDGLGLSTFSTREELFALLAKPPGPIRNDQFNDMSVIVSRIDSYCQENL